MNPSAYIIYTLQQYMYLNLCYDTPSAHFLFLTFSTLQYATIYSWSRYGSFDVLKSALEYVYLWWCVFTIIRFCIRWVSRFLVPYKWKAFVSLFLSAKLLSYPYLKVFSNGKWWQVTYLRNVFSFRGYFMDNRVNIEIIVLICSMIEPNVFNEIYLLMKAVFVYHLSKLRIGNGSAVGSMNVTFKLCSFYVKTFKAFTNHITKWFTEK